MPICRSSTGITRSPDALQPPFFLQISRQEPDTRHVYTESIKRLLNAVGTQLPDKPNGPTAREIAIGTVGLLMSERCSWLGPWMIRFSLEIFWPLVLMWPAP